MLFLVISTPRPESPSLMTERRQKAWVWLEPYLQSKTIHFMHARVGRGAVAMIDVPSNLELHKIINEWAEIVPGTHDIYPLIDSAEAQAYLKVHKAI